MNAVAAINTYFSSMRTESLAYIVPVGLAMLAFSAVLILRPDRNSFSLWAGFPLALCGAVAVAAGIGFVLFSNQHLPETLDALCSDPAETVRSELERAQKILSESRFYYVAYATLMGAAFALMFGIGSDWARGLAIPLMAFAAVSFCGDAFIQKRAQTYIEAIENVALASAGDTTQTERNSPHD